MLASTPSSSSPSPLSPPESRGQLSWDRLWDDTVWNWGAISTSLFKVFYSFAGLDNISNVLNEVKDPVRTLRSVTMTSLFTACGMYLLINVAYFLVVPVDKIKDSGELIAALFFEQILVLVSGGGFCRLLWHCLLLEMCLSWLLPWYVTNLSYQIETC